MTIEEMQKVTWKRVRVQREEVGADGDTQAGVGSELGSGGTDTDSDKVGGGSGPAEQPAGGGAGRLWSQVSARPQC